MQIIKKNRYWRSQRFVIGFAGFMFWLVTCPSWGQGNQKRPLTKDDYALWGKFVARKISNEGNWASYLVWYESKKDTLFVKNTKNKTAYPFPYAKDGIFNGESHFGCIARDTLLLQNLTTGTFTKTAGVTDFAFSGNEKYLLLLKKQANQKQSLVVQDRDGKAVVEIPNVSKWRLEPNRNGLLYCVDSADQNAIGFLKLGLKIKKNTIISGSNGAFQNLNWKGNTIVFIQNLSDDPQLFSYSIDTKKLNHFDANTQPSFPADMKISDAIGNTLTVSDDGDRIFFWLKENQDRLRPIDPATVQVWNAADKLVFAHKKNFGQYTLMDKMAVWSVKSNRFIQISDREIPKGFLSGDYKHAFIYDPIAYEPQNSFDGEYDLYLVDLTTVIRKRILEKYSGDNSTVPSSDGKFLLYAKEGNWWMYDIEKDTHTNITKTIPVSFFRQDQDMPIQPAPYGVAGWTEKDKSVILYDQYDLWQITADATIKKRLTNGREIQRTYRIKDLIPESLYQSDEIDTKKPPLQLNNEFVLSAIDQNSRASGFCKWNLKNGVTSMVWEQKKVNQIIKASNNDRYLYVEQSYEVAPRLMLYDTAPQEIVQSNPQQSHFYWGKAEPIRYNVNGKELSGILYYPAEYQSGVKYPMIVHVYQRQFQHLNDYENPSSYVGDGFNITNFTTQGYFVLYPDLVLETANVGKSATVCVLSAVDAVIAKGFVDPQKVGLIGHSFGGYETDLIITQTDRFATAVAGAAWTDLTSAYLYVGTTFYRPDFYRAEHDQLRIGKSLFEDRESYLKNSPVLQAPNVKTPLLGWTGEEDRHIHYLQSMEFYMALRRLNKTHTLLVYPEEEHTLWKRKNQKDLTSKVEQWFNYYLKNDQPQSWMKSEFY
ncbi:alpha/beta hydrolase family protein [Flavobacterium taihuense]|uniref:Prolyl oligopeptidase family serine peptidase n=1 Tax=Flavobacterium taihuense TaxID=2857508 RepID=A0ABS6XSW9_9FLAO|nr:prolyl oligopeptidase family serine peptidase [Flavobacterium taihuense]MBW4359341.1 prolyl oligopeptidase family serine peptidase [Flavobacterium taihuense]